MKAKKFLYKLWIGCAYVFSICQVLSVVAVYLDVYTLLVFFVTLISISGVCFITIALLFLCRHFKSNHCNVRTYDSKYSKGYGNPCEVKRSSSVFNCLPFGPMSDKINPPNNIKAISNQPNNKNDRTKYSLHRDTFPKLLILAGAYLIIIWEVSMLFLMRHLSNFVKNLVFMGF